MSVVEYKNLIAFHPSYYLKEILECSSLTEEQIATSLNVPLEELKQWLDGEIRTTRKLADKLELEFSVTAKTWLNLQKRYDKQLLKIKNLQKNIL